MTKANLKRLTLDLPPNVHQGLKQAALDQNTTIRALLLKCAETIVNSTYQRSASSAGDVLKETKE